MYFRWCEKKTDSQNTYVYKWIKISRAIFADIGDKIETFGLIKKRWQSVESLPQEIDVYLSGRRFKGDASPSAVTSDDASNWIFTKQPAPRLDYTTPLSLRIPPSATSRLQSCDLILKAAFPSRRQSQTYIGVRLLQSALRRDCAGSDNNAKHTCNSFIPSFISLVTSIHFMLVYSLVSSKEAL